MLSLDAQIESLLFWEAEPLSIAKLCKLLKKGEPEVRQALLSLEARLTGRGVVVVRKDDEVALKTAPEMSALIETLAKEELAKDLGKAGLETLSIILYHSPVTRRDIDYIRGVNSTFILRNLMIRGLVERVPNPKDQRSLLYKPTFELLAFMGLSKIEDLPEYGAVRKEIETFKTSAIEAEKTPVDSVDAAPTNMENGGNE